MKQQFRFLIPIATFIIICIPIMYFPYCTIPGIFFRSALFQSIIVCLVCFYNFSHHNKQGIELRKHLSKRTKIILTHYAFLLIITNLPNFVGLADTWFFDPISLFIPIIFYTRIENFGNQPDSRYQLVLEINNEQFLNFLSLAIHFILIYFICYQVLKIITQEKDVVFDLKE